MQEQSERILVPSERSQSRWRLILGGMLLLVLVTTVLAYLWNLKYNKYRFHEMRYGVTVTDKATEKQANQARQNAIADVETLRKDWRPWAWRHRDLLMQMRMAAPNDVITLSRVYDALPPTPNMFGDRSLFGMPSSDKLGAGALGFSWQPVDRLTSQADVSRVYPDPEEQKKQELIDAFVANARQKRFAKYRDIELSKSISLGGDKMTLWVSGRITEQTRVRQFTPGQRAWVDGPEKQISPPYDFLSSNREKTGGQAG